MMVSEVFKKLAEGAIRQGWRKVTGSSVVSPGGEGTMVLHPHPHTESIMFERVDSRGWERWYLERGDTGWRLRYAGMVSNPSLRWVEDLLMEVGIWEEVEVLKVRGFRIQSSTLKRLAQLATGRDDFIAIFTPGSMVLCEPEGRISPNNQLPLRGKLAHGLFVETGLTSPYWGAISRKALMRVRERVPQGEISIWFGPSGPSGEFDLWIEGYSIPLIEEELFGALDRCYKGVWERPLVRFEVNPNDLKGPGGTYPLMVVLPKWGVVQLEGGGSLPVQVENPQDEASAPWGEAGPVIPIHPETLRGLLKGHRGRAEIRLGLLPYASTGDAVQAVFFSSRPGEEVWTLMSTRVRVGG